MKPQSYYLSVPLDPWREDNGVTSLDVTENGHLQYKRDSIVNRIGNDSCKHFINMYFNELKEELDEQKFRDFFVDCIQQIMEEYQLSNLEYFINYFIDYDSWSLYNILDFFELNKWKDVLKNVLPPDPDILVYSDKELKKYIKESRKEIRKKLKKEKDILPDKIYSALIYCSKDELAFCFMKLIKKDRHELVSEMLEKGD